MKIALTGGSGIQGMSAMIYLLDQDDVEEIFVSDMYNIDRLKQRVNDLNDNRLVMAELDCTDEAAAAEAFKGYDVVLNSAMTRGHYIKTTRAALKAGVDYLDMTSLGEEPLQMELHDQFKEKGLTCLLDMGTRCSGPRSIPTSPQIRSPSKAGGCVLPAQLYQSHPRHNQWCQSYPACSYNIPP